MQPTTTIDLVLDRQTARDVLHAVLHAVLFHRLFGTVKPRTIDIYDVTLVCSTCLVSFCLVPDPFVRSNQPGVQDPEIERLIEEKVNMFWKSVENGTNKRGQASYILSLSPSKKSDRLYISKISVTLSDKRQKKGFFWQVGEVCLLPSYFVKQSFDVFFPVFSLIVGRRSLGGMVYHIPSFKSLNTDSHNSLVG